MGGGRSMFGGGGGGSELEKMKTREAEKRKDRANAMKTGAGMLASASLATLGSYLAFGPQTENKDGDINESTENESLKAEEDVIDGSQEFSEFKENEGDFIGPKEPVLDEDGNPILQPLPSLDDDVVDGGGVVDGDGVISNEPVVSDGDEPITSTPINPEGDVITDVSTQESIDGSSKQESVDGSSTKLTPETGGKDVKGEKPNAQSSISDTQTHTEGGSVNSQQESLQRDTLDKGAGGSITNNGTLTSVEGAESTVANASEIANNAESIVASTEDKSDKSVSSVANETSSEVSQSSVSKSESPMPPSEKPVESVGSKPTTTNSSGKPEKSIGKFRQTIGKTMMAMGGVDHKTQLDKGSIKGMATAGIMHAVGGAVGAHKLTQNHAQRKIDQRNEHIVRNGGQVKSNLSATRESRQDAQKRLEKRVQETPRPIQANPSQPGNQESVRRQRQSERRQSPKQDPREDN